MDRIYRAGSKKLYEIEFPEMPGVVFTVEEDVRRALIEGQVLAEWMAAVAAEVWGRRSDEDRRRVMAGRREQCSDNPYTEKGEQS